jgi:hypothetical protein
MVPNAESVECVCEALDGLDRLAFDTAGSRGFGSKLFQRLGNP